MTSWPCMAARRTSASSTSPSTIRALSGSGLASRLARRRYRVGAASVLSSSILVVLRANCPLAPRISTFVIWKRLRAWPSSASKLLSRRAEQDLVHVHVLGLLDRKGDHAREAVGRNGVTLVKIGNAGCHVRLSDA